MEEDSLAKQVGLLVRHLRLKAGLSQEGFADLCGLHRTYVGSIERGEKVVSIKTAQKVCHALGFSLSQFFKLLEKELSKQKESRFQ